MADYSEIAVQIEGRIPYVGLYRNFSYKGILIAEHCRSFAGRSLEDRASVM